MTDSSIFSVFFFLNVVENCFHILIIGYSLIIVFFVFHFIFVVVLGS